MRRRTSGCIGFIGRQVQLSGDEERSMLSGDELFPMRITRPSRTRHCATLSRLIHAASCSGCSAGREEADENESAAVQPAPEDGHVSAAVVELVAAEAAALGRREQAGEPSRPRHALAASQVAGHGPRAPVGRQIR